MVPGWLEILARVSLALAFLSSAIVLFDIPVLGKRQKMAIMNAVWPVTALYFGPFALWAYWSMDGCPPGWLSTNNGTEARGLRVAAISRGRLP